MRESDEFKRTVNTLRELGEDWRENMAVVKDASRGSGEMMLLIRRLFKENNQSSLVKIGLACLVFPEPIVSDVLGYSLLAAGLIQRRIKNSAVYLEDVNKSFPKLLKELQGIRREMV